MADTREGVAAIGRRLGGLVREKVGGAEQTHWICSRCGAHNRVSNTTCFRCHEKRSYVDG